MKLSRIGSGAAFMLLPLSYILYIIESIKRFAWS